MVSGISSFSTAALSETRQRMFNRIDTGGDGSIDAGEFAALARQQGSGLIDELFSNMDADQDSLIGRMEFDSALTKLEKQMKNGGPGMAGMPPHSPPPDQVFDAADTDGDGTVSEDELTALLGDKATEVFAEVDTDGDGLITRAEDETFRSTMDERMSQRDPGMSAMRGISSSPPRPDQVFELSDTDGDGSVSEDELAALLGDKATEVFAEVDTDGDGLITRVEDETFRSTMDERMKKNGPTVFGMDGSGQDWQSRLLDALLSGLAAAADETTRSSSLYA